ncbi:MAG TPA: ABC transporter ATP-binding protein [Steroidobacteraceae bacterium]|jgi:ABC-type multidrug transport system fused ATPase/permease subunit|nr:ABC transporter ATP-binding protein [Steroidobacteraceae bacterium]
MGLMVLSAFAEVVSLGAVLPFLGILTAPQAVFKYRLVARIAHAAGITAPQQLLLPLTIAFAAIALIAGAIRMLLLWVSTRFTFAAGADLSIEVYRRTLYQPYRVHVARNSSEVISGITNKVGGTVLGVLLPFMTLISSMMLLVAIPVALIAINPIVALVATLGFGASYAVITWLSRRHLRSNSERIANEQTEVIKAIQEGLGGIRDVLLDGTQPVFCDVYRRADQLLRRAQGDNVFIGQSPRYAMEALGMILIAALAYGLSRQDQVVASALPVLGALALGAQRLLPALQQAFGAWASIAGSQAYLADTITLIDQPLPAEMLQAAPAPLPFCEAIQFRAVRFRYTEPGPWVLDGLDLIIPKGARVGLVGGTGSGKSTTLDLLMGLLLPTEGEVIVDGESLVGRRIRTWQRTIAHVPQSIYLADTTMTQNIAFGVPREAIDMQRVRQAAQQAQIAEFIESGPRGYDALVGERGIRLSGGQRQRIGIARALYKRASVLVLDEATSALDNATERSVMDAIEGLHRDLTILIIAHRLTTVRRCDTIVELQHGRVVAQASYEELLECSQSFRHMALATRIS